MRTQKTFVLVLLDTREVEEAGGDWSGSFIGTSFIFSHEANLGALEGGGE